VDAEALGGQYVSEVAQQSAPIVGADRELDAECAAVRTAPFDLEHAVGLARRHPQQARAIAPMYRDATTEADITRDGLRPQRRAAARQGGRQVADAFDLDRRAAAACCGSARG